MTEEATKGVVDMVAMAAANSSGVVLLVGGVPRIKGIKTGIPSYT